MISSCRLCQKPIRSDNTTGVCTRATCREKYQRIRTQEVLAPAVRKGRVAVANAKRRAKMLGVPCTLTLSTLPPIPDLCPVLGIKMDLRASAWGADNNPELDRIKPSLGYIPENVHWISRRANAIKRNATPAELRLVAAYFERIST